MPRLSAPSAKILIFSCAVFTLDPSAFTDSMIACQRALATSGWQRGFGIQNAIPLRNSNIACYTRHQKATHDEPKYAARLFNESRAGGSRIGAGFTRADAEDLRRARLRRGGRRQDTG